VTVPRVVGLKQNAAVQRLNDRGLTPQIRTGKSTFSAGTVFAQDPQAGAEVTRRSRVTISVSAVSVVRVPNVVGTRTAQAVQRLRAAGLGSQVTTVAAKVGAGVVVAQTPGAGRKIAKGSTVALRVSKGQTTVPDVQGQAVSDARAALRAAGLVPETFQVPGAEPKGTVIAQKPLPGTAVARGSKVRINVSTGSATTGGGTGTTTAAAAKVDVPDVTGQPQRPATQTLRAAGFRVTATTVDLGDPSQNGKVVDQDPAGGTSAPKGSLVTISVNQTA
jgi:serine/threonine-protein kinase